MLLVKRSPSASDTKKRSLPICSEQTRKSNVQDDADLQMRSR